MDTHHPAMNPVGRRVLAHNVERHNLRRTPRALLRIARQMALAAIASTAAAWVMW